MKITTVAVADIPESTGCVGRVSVMQPVYEKLCGLKRGQALKVEFDSPTKALSGRAALRKIATRHDEFVSSSKADGGATRFFWLEPKDK